MFRVPVVAEVTSPGEQRASAIMGSDKEAEIAQMTKPIAERKGGEIALVDEHGETTWSEFDERVNRMIHAVRAAGLTTGDTIALMCGNRREFFEVTVAAIHAGLVVVPVNWHWVAAELAYVIADSDAAALIVEGRYAAVAAEACADDRAVGCPTRIVIGDPVPDGFEAYEQVLARSAPDEPEEQSSGGPMFYTSGTTGFPKGVRSGLTATGHDPALVALVAQAAVGLLQIPSDGVTLLEGPAYHSAQWALSVLPLLGAASTVVMRHHFDAAELLELVDRYGVTNIHLVPTQFIRLLKLHDEVREGFGGESLVTVIHGAAPCPLEVKQRMLAWWGPVITEYYGGTEGGFLSIVSAQEWLAKPGSLGRPTNTTELMIVAEDGHVCEVGEAGQIYFKSRIGTDFEYHKAPKKTEAAHLAPGVGTLGDVGYLDDDGYLFMSDRKIDMIISGGVNIYPAEIEGVLVCHPVVTDAAVFGIPDDEMGEQVKAAVELAAGTTASDDLAAELIAYAREHLAGYKVPKTIDFEEQLPRSPTGKLYKRLLRDPYWEGSGRTI
jgi:long-chain acyl-CoA synthetase